MDDRALKRADEEINHHEAYARSEALFSSIGIGALATDEFGRIYRINDAALKLLEYNREDLIGKWFPKAVIAVDEKGKVINPIERPITHAFISGKSIVKTMNYRTKSKKILPVSVTVSPIILDGRPVGAVEVFRDIRVENEIDRMKTEFISIASHQLRTPLSAINTYASMLYNGFYGKLSKDQKNHMSTILQSIDRMNELISTLLDISQIEAGKLNVNSQPVDIKALLETITNDLDSLAEQKNLDVQCNYPSKNMLVTSDQLLLGEVFSNLISNAYKYTPINGTVTINVTATAKNITFSVQDTGYGIPKNLQKHIFTKFYRADNIKKIDTTGTGLGLYLAKQVAEVLGGDLWFESALNRGSTFYFKLPK